MKNLLNTVKVILGAAAAVYFAKADEAKREVIASFTAHKELHEELKAKDLGKMQLSHLLVEFEDWVTVAQSYVKARERLAEKLFPFNTLTAFEGALTQGALDTQMVSARMNVQKLFDEIENRI